LFTGLIEGTGEVFRSGGDTLLVAAVCLEEVLPGESVAVDGTCLTVSEANGSRTAFHVSGETLSKTIAGGYAKGTEVNLELPLRAGGRLHGHIVTGHVDCTARVLKTEPAGADLRIWISLGKGFREMIVEKGSVAVSGISLTVASVEEGAFSVVAIPETLDRTTASKWKPGTMVNLEFDIIGKYVLRHLGAVEGDSRLRAFLEE
jgi:riboflavin synthase